MMAEEPLLTVAEVAERLRVNPETVRVWLRDGKLHGFIPARRIGWRIPASELERLGGQLAAPPPAEAESASLSAPQPELRYPLPAELDLKVIHAIFDSPLQALAYPPDKVAALLSADGQRELLDMLAQIRKRLDAWETVVRGEQEV